jgi:hypothetical protein
VAVINFAVTMAGLEQQLLRRVVMAERPELEVQRLRLVEEVPTNLKTLKCLEDDLLYRLANSTGNLLDDASAHRGARHDEEDHPGVEGEAFECFHGRRAHLDRVCRVPAGGHARRAALLLDRRHGGHQRHVPLVAPAVPRAF